MLSSQFTLKENNDDYKYNNTTDFLIRKTNHQASLHQQIRKYLLNSPFRKHFCDTKNCEGTTARNLRYKIKNIMFQIISASGSYFSVYPSATVPEILNPFTQLLKLWLCVEETNHTSQASRKIENSREWPHSFTKKLPESRYKIKTSLNLHGVNDHTKYI